MALCHISADRGRDRPGQALAAPLLGERQAVPAARDEGGIGLLEAVGRAHDAVLEPDALAIAALVERRQLVRREPAGRLQDVVDQVRRRRLVARQAADRAEIGDVVEHEAHVVERRRVAGHVTFPMARRARPARPQSTAPGFRIPLGSRVCFDLAHQRQLERRLARRELGPLEPADAVLGADRAAERRDQVEHLALHLVLQRDERLGRHRRGLQQVVVDVAIAQMAERHDAHARDRAAELLGTLRDQLRHPRDRHRDVVAQHRTLVRHRIRRVLAQRPDRLALRLARRDHAALDQALLHGRLQRLLEARRQAVLERPGDLGQDVPRRRLRRSGSRAPGR